MNEKAASPAETEVPNGSASWSTSGLRLAIELGKDSLAGQAQRRLALEQRAGQLAPLCATMLLALTALAYGGRFTPVGNSYVFLWAMVVALLIGMLLALATVARPIWGYTGMEPKDALYKYAANGGENGLLKSILEEYQSRIEGNARELRRLFGLNIFSSACIMAGIIYGATMIYANRSQTPPPASGATQQRMAPPPTEPDPAPTR